MCSPQLSGAKIQPLNKSLSEMIASATRGPQPGSTPSPTASPTPTTPDAPAVPGVETPIRNIVRRNRLGIKSSGGSGLGIPL